MNNEVWKHFAEHEVSHSMAHYLTTIRDLRANQGYARVSDVAKELDVTKGSVSVQVKHLKEKGLVAEDVNRHLQLTGVGDEVARQVMCTRQVLIRLFSEMLGVDPHTAESDACKIEHLLSFETCSHLLTLLRMMKSDSPVVKDFLEAYRSFQLTCPGVANCDICEDVCTMDPHRQSAGS